MEGKERGVTVKVATERDEKRGKEREYKERKQLYSGTLSSSYLHTFYLPY